MTTPSNEEPETRFDAARQRMVLEQLAARGIDDPRVLAAVSRVPRHEFVLPDWRDDAYRDRALPIDCEQTISQPYTVAFMAQAAEVLPTDRILEIGTGSGYGAAVLSLLGHSVYTVERIASLAEQAEQRLKRLGFTNVHVYQTDGTLGLPDAAPFEVIVVTAAGKELPTPLADQLADGGRIIIPLGSHNAQCMYRFRREPHRLSRENLGGFAFVPLIGRHGWSA